MAVAPAIRAPAVRLDDADRLSGRLCRGNTSAIMAGGPVWSHRQWAVRGDVRVSPARTVVRRRRPLARARNRRLLLSDHPALLPIHVRHRGLRVPVSYT